MQNSDESMTKRLTISIDQAISLAMCLKEVSTMTTKSKLVANLCSKQSLLFAELANDGRWQRRKINEELHDAAREKETVMPKKTSTLQRITAKCEQMADRNGMADARTG